MSGRNQVPPGQVAVGRRMGGAVVEVGRVEMLPAFTALVLLGDRRAHEKADQRFL